MSVRALSIWMAVTLSLLSGLLLSGTASAAGPLNIYVQPDNALHITGHRCAVIGTDQYGNQGISCADFAYRGHPDGGTYYDVWGHNQVFCQDAVDRVVQCAGIHETVALEIPPGSVLTSAAGVCGARFGHSPCAAGRVQNYSPVHTSSVVPNGYWGSSIRVSIVLPRSNKTVSGHDLSSVHYQVITPASR